MQSAVYVNHGRAIVDCPIPRCGNAYLVERGQKARTCDALSGGCRTLFSIKWPKHDLDEILNELAKRPFVDTRNWLPEGHPLAVEGHPTDQTPAQLAEEFAALQEAEERKRRGELA